jgi:hypothetical protein
VEHGLLRRGHTVREKLTGMTGRVFVLDLGSYLDVNGPLAQTAKSQP